ncbi:hypothetical protein [Lentzea albidocapillata]|uniref:Uncharacterized protein n=1 Tax=Lentzea albidocapillata TaxID=40571 RepID=A0A1W2FKN3_9PSEU|nr:hypothetical protein [Lentzea albidocapillata]SMD22525.1 hypothetical protein SAMN05660733_06854 [Lentzea albidocapillata]
MVSTRPALQVAAIFTALAFALPFSSGTAAAAPITQDDNAAHVQLDSAPRIDDIGIGIGLGISTGHHWHDCHDWDDDWDDHWHHGHHGLLDGISIGIGVGLHIG